MKTVIEHARILTMDRYNTRYEDGHVIIEDDRITAVGAGKYSEDGSGNKSAEQAAVINAHGGILMPGMISTHCHVSMIPFRTMGDDAKERLSRFIFPLEDGALTPDLVYLAALYGMGEMLLSGVTAFLDMYYFEDKVAEAAEISGMRAFLGETVKSSKSCDSDSPYGGVGYGEEFIRDWKGRDPLISPLIAPYASHTCSADVLETAYGIAEKYDTLFTLHNCETKEGTDYFNETFEMTPTKFLSGLGVLSPRTVLAHCVYITDEDTELIAKSGAKISYCIGSDMKAGHDAAPLEKMTDKGIPVGLGTDGAAYGNTLDMFTQFRLAADFNKSVCHDPAAFPAKQIVRLGTAAGAGVLGTEEVCGSIEPGKQADLVLIECDSANMFPCYNPYSAIVSCAGRENVDRVWVAGKELVSGGKLTCFDLAETRDELSENMAEFYKKAQEYSSGI